MNNPESTSNTPRTQPESFRGRDLSISLTANDVTKSVAWYCDVVGFTVEKRHEHEGQLRAVSLKAGDVRLLINQENGARGLNRVKGEGFSFMITTAQSVDDVAARIKANGGTLDTEPADMPWGGRVFKITDPDGFRFVISTLRDG